MSSHPDYAPTGSAAPAIDGPGDAELISAVRAGDIEAYGTLFARHREAARRLARQLVSSGDVDDLVSEAFSKVLGVLQRGGGPDLAFRAYLLTSMRRLHVDKLRATSRLTTTDDLTPYDPGVPFNDTMVSGFENATAAKAFASLPERWQQVLWHTEVEGQKPADIAPLLGMSANSVSALAYRAREGLRQAFVTMHANDAAEDVCATVRAELGAYIRGGTSRRTSTKIEQHLGDCRECTAIYLELTEVNSHLGAILAPALLGTAGAGYLAAAHGVAAKGVLVGIGHWLWNTPAGKATSVTGGVAAAAAAAAIAVAATSGSHAPAVASAKAPIVSTPAPPAKTIPPAAPTPPTTQAPASIPVRSTVPSPVVTTPSATAVAPPVVAPPVIVPPVIVPPTSGPQIVTAPAAVTAPLSGSVTINLLAGVTDPVGGLHLVGTPTAGHGSVALAIAARSSARFVALAGAGPELITYTPDPGWKGTDTIAYTIGDAAGRTVAGTVQVTTPDAPPVAQSFTLSQPVPAAWSSPQATVIDVLAHTSDPNPQDTVTLTSATNGTHGTTKVVDGKVAYTPNPGEGSTATSTITDTFTYTVTDGTDTSTGTATVTFGQLPDRSPVAGDLSINAAYGTPVSFDLPANDPDGDPLKVTFSGDQASSINVTGLHATYTPPTGFSGTTTFTYTVADSAGLSASATINVVVAPAPVTLGLSVHHPPTLGYIGTHFDATGVPVGQSATFTLTIHGFLGWTPGTAGGVCGNVVVDPIAQTAKVTCAVAGDGEVVHADFFAAPGWYLDASLTPVGYAATTATIHLQTPPSP